MNKKVGAAVSAVAAVLCASALAACNEPEDHYCVSDTYVLQTVLREPTCTDDGWGLFVCPVPKCGNSREMPIGRKEHNYVDFGTGNYLCLGCGTPAPDGYEPDGPNGSEDPDEPGEPLDPDLADSEEFTFVNLEGRTLSWSRLKAASKYVISVTPSGADVPTEYTVEKSNGSVDLDAIGITSGRSSVKLSAYTVEKVNIDGGSYEQEVLMRSAVEEFRIDKRDGQYSLIRLEYSDDMLKLNGFYSEKQSDGNGGEYYLCELRLTDNKPTKFNVSKQVKAASGCTVKYYRTADGRANGTGALSSFDLMTDSVTSSVTYYVRVTSGTGATRDYDLRIDGLSMLEINRYKLIHTVNADGVRVYEKELIGSALRYAERDIIPVETLFEGVAYSCGRDGRYNMIERKDYVAASPAFGTTLELYFYDEAAVVSDCSEYNKYAKIYTMTEYDGGWALATYGTQCVGIAVLPNTICGKPVLSAIFSSSSATELYVEEGVKTFTAKFTDCGALTDIYLPTSLRTVGMRAFGGINDDAVIHCAFASNDTGSFDAFWNYKSGSNAEYTTYYLEGYSVPEI